MLERRHFLRAAAATAAGAGLISSAEAQELKPNLADPPGYTPPPRNWNPHEEEAIYPDKAFEVFDPSFKKYNAGTAPLWRVYMGAQWAEGPVYFADQHVVIFSDIPNNRMLRYDEVSHQTTVFRQPSGNSNGNTRDWQGRLITCEHSGRRVTRTEYNGEITVLADNYQGKKLNSPNGVVVKKSDNTIWFTDPSYGIMGDDEGIREPEELPRNVYMIDPRSGKMTVASDEFDQPNGLCFSPDEKLFYITDTGKEPLIRVYDVSEDNKLTNGRLFHKYANGELSDDIRVDETGALWSAGGWGPDTFNGVSVYAPDGTPIGRIWTPETASNLCFGGYHHQHSWLYITAGRSLYVMPVHTRGVEL